MWGAIALVPTHAADAEPPTRFLQLFNVFHRSLPNSTADYAAEHVTLFAVAKQLDKCIGAHAAHLPLVREWHLRHHDPFLQELGYHETSAILHVGANRLHRASRFVGFSQYDHVLKLPDESDVPPNGALLYALAEPVLLDEPAFPRSWVEQHYERHHGRALNVAATVASLGGHFPAFNNWIIPSATFERLWPWWRAVAYDLAWIKREPYPRRWRHHRHIAGVMERVIGLSIAAEEGLAFLQVAGGLRMDVEIRNEMYELGAAAGRAPKRVIPGEVEETDADVVARNLARPLSSRLPAPAARSGGGGASESGGRGEAAASTATKVEL